ncbi:MAG: aminotransferase class I/II-fold pyridoxal phosphate-dependent enzyme [Pseudomonadota bacterium]
MVFPERFSNLPAYAFPRLRTLLDPFQPGGEPVNLTIGEPRHDFPDFVLDSIAQHVDEFRKYPVNEGAPVLLAAISEWLNRRFGIRVPPEQVMTLNGTREGLYNAAMTLCPEEKNGTPVILIPNPFYQVYAIATISVGAEAQYLNATPKTGFLPDLSSLDATTLNRTTAFYLCSPSNPQGAVASRNYWRDALALAEKYDFKIFSDECYSEVYRDKKPVSGLQMASELGADPERVVIFHSLSKRSNLPGLRSGFIAGGPESIRRARQLRAYAGTPLPMPLQHAAARVWADETHVEVSRKRYVAKYDIANEVFAGIEGCGAPEAGFFLWLPVDDGEAATVRLWKETGVRVLPGAYLAREVEGGNPGTGYIRVAMVADEEELQRGLIALRDCIYV